MAKGLNILHNRLILCRQRRMFNHEAPPALCVLVMGR
jgi:hypothetical protein